MKRVICLFLALALMLSGLCGCGSLGSSKKVEDLIERFEDSCNSLDIDAILDCIIPRISNSVKTVFGLIGAVSDMENEEIFNYITEALTSEEGLDGADFFESIDIRIDEILVEGEIATVACYVSYEINGEKMNREATFTCEYYAEEWYITAFVFN